MWEYILGGAAVFGSIVTLGSWINGWITRKEISKLMAEEHRATRRMLAKMDERFEPAQKDRKTYEDSSMTTR